MARRGHTNVDQFQDEAPPGFMNDFKEGLKTEFTGLNFPPNAATDTDNCVFTMLGDVTRRKGFDFEDNYALNNLGDRTSAALSTYVWRNAGGDGESVVYVAQVGLNLEFFSVTDATVDSPVSQHKLSSVVDLTPFAISGPARSAQCQFADGNGYLFVYCNACDPFYCTFDPIGKTVTSNRITVKIRDFNGIPEPGVDTTHRDTSITQEHEYNLFNQGWTRAPLWTVNADDFADSNLMGDAPGVNIPLSFTGNGIIGIGVAFGDHNWIVGGGLPITVGTPVDITYAMTMNVYDITAGAWQVQDGTGTAKGVVKAYNTGTGAMTVDVTNTTPALHADNLEFNIPLGPMRYVVSSSKSINTIDTWNTAIGNFPSNADIWWIFKDQLDVFNPSATIGAKGLPSAWAPKGHYILDAFNQDRQGVANGLNQYGGTLSGLTVVTTSKRPTNGTWFQGRVWYTGVDDSQQKTGDQNFYTWTENIYFSKIVEGVDDFGFCHEENDPTDQYSFNLLPSDGGVITIQGCGSIFRLFPIQNGMLVFAANGVWFITGSQGIGFSASDYTITKISAVRSISSNSYVDVQGLPMFWNEEGIYTVAPAQQGLGLTVNPLTTGTIKSFYDQIPLDTKKRAKGSYNPIDYVVQWVYGDKILVQQEVIEQPPDPGPPYPAASLTSGVTGNQVFKWDGNAGLALHMEDGGTVQSWSIPGNTAHTAFQPGSSTNTGVHIMDSGVIVVGNSSGGGIPTFSYWNASGVQIGGTHTLVHDLGFFGMNVMYMEDVGDSLIALFGSAASSSMYWITLKASTGDALLSPVSSALSPGFIAASAGISASSTYAYAVSSDGGAIARYNYKTGVETLILKATLGISETILAAVYDPFTGAVIISAGAKLYKFSEDLSTNLGHTLTLAGTPSGTVAKRAVRNGKAVFRVASPGVQSTYYEIDTATMTLLRTLETDLIWGGTPDTLGGAYGSDGTFIYRFNELDVIWAANHLTGSSDIIWLGQIPVAQGPAILFEDDWAFNKALNFNTFTQAFYPWSIATGTINGVSAPVIHSIDYIAEPGSINGIKAGFRYFSSVLNVNNIYNFSLADCTDETYVDWDYATETTGDVYSSYFVTGYSLAGQGLHKFQPTYLTMFSRTNGVVQKYFIQGIWDFASSSSSGRWTNKQLATVGSDTHYGMDHKRHRIRGSGLALQIKVSSVDNNPFDIMGWATMITQNQGV